MTYKEILTKGRRTTMSEINLSFWDLERIEKEQDKHITAYTISPIDKKKIAEYIDKEVSACDTLKDAIDSIIHKVQEQSEMYYICEIAKLYIESQRPAEWIEDSGNIACSHCHIIWLHRKTDFCPNCGRRMKNG